MRTTIDLQEDVFLAAKEVAMQRGNTLGKLISNLARQTPPCARVYSRGPWSQSKSRDNY
jgi:predicted DNA-binding ribbon-helix-helix protein